LVTYYYNHLFGVGGADYAELILGQSVRTTPRSSFPALRFQTIAYFGLLSFLFPLSVVLLGNNGYQDGRDGATKKQLESGRDYDCYCNTSYTKSKYYPHRGCLSIFEPFDERGLGGGGQEEGSLLGGLHAQRIAVQF